ncbi:MAG: hypothetical protein HQ541_15595 [Mariniphaga sp.]|nr:hypothetical protein [Mariniphaga sp.]
MFIIPVAMILLCRFGISRLSDVVPILRDYYWMIVAVFTCIAASTPAYLMGFILLDERDENVHTILKILPLPENFVLKCRVGFMVLLGLLFSILILLFNGLIFLSFINIILASILFSLIPPILTFAIVSFSKNKIEAVTMYKGLNSFLVIPLAAFFIPFAWKYAFGIIPFFWTFNSIQIMENNKPVIISFLIGIVVHLIFIIFLYRIYNRKVV